MIAFVNSGLIDLRAIYTFGWHVKETANPIGAFGTGSRYAIATLLRLGCNVLLYRGLDKYAFGMKKVSGRANSTFDLIVMSGPDGEEKEMPFTSHLGKNWVAWEAFRELHSNALDENGYSYRASSYQPAPNQTAFVVEGEAIEAAFNDRHKIFLDTKPLIVSEKMDVHEGSSEYAYYRGVRIFKLPRPSLFTYNLKSLTYGITEDRTLKSQCDLDMNVNALVAATDHIDFLRSVLIASENSYEHHIHPWWAADPSPAFEEVYETLRKEGRAIALTSLANATWKVKHKNLPLPDPIVMTKIQKKQLEKAVKFCKDLGWNVEEYPIVVVPQARDGLMALAEGGKIVLTVGCFNQGTKIVAQAVLEEYLHLKYGFQDLTRPFQTHLFEQIITLGERILEEPL